MSQSAATTSMIISAATANPRRTTLAAVGDFGQLPGGGAVRRIEYAAELPASTANPRRTVLMVAPAPRKPVD
ncbi:hypothetical protein [Kitasatospora sp. HPMI-4]|uniref:hypothetical protein n=1 Tax=Kitasatospora sp. HPMI-4 TaxID=3448443 RepID=UPI003F19574D